MRYLRLWLQFLKFSWMADLEYRMNFVVRVIGEFFWYTAQLSVFEVLYTHTETLHGWDINAVRVFMGTLFLVDGLYMILFHENLDHLSSLVRKGDLDLYLVKPINSQFMISCRRVSSVYFINITLVLGYLGWAVSRLNHSIELTQVLAYLVMVACGLCIYYCMRLLFGMLAIVLHEAGNIQFVWYNLFRLGTRPDVLYPRTLRLVIMTAIPVAFIASAPAKMLVEGANGGLLLHALALVSFLIALTAFLWKRALRQYASASS